MGSIGDQQEITSWGTLVRHFKKHLPPWQMSLPVVQNYIAMLALVNKVGASHRAFPKFMTLSQLLAFCDCESGMVWDVYTKTHTEPLANDQERVMGLPSSELEN